jgi:hypothetical protein
MAVIHDHGGLVGSVRHGPTIGIGVQAVVLALLAATVGLDVAGWAAGVSYGVVTFARSAGAFIGLARPRSVRPTG